MRPFSGSLALLAIVKKSFRLLSRRDQHTIIKLTFAQFALSIFDLIGIALVGLVTSLAVTGVNSRSPNAAVSFFIETLKLESLSFQIQTAILSTLTLFVFVFRTILSTVFIRRLFFFLGKQGAEIAENLCGKVLSGSILDLGRFSPQQYIYSLTSGVEVITLRIIGISVNLLSDLFLLTCIFLVMALVNISMTIIVTLVVSFSTYALHQLTTKRSKQLGSEYSLLNIQSRETLSDAFSSFKEMKAKGRAPYYEMEFRSNRQRISKSVAEYNFFPFLSKYVIELSMVFSAFIVAGAQLILTDAVNALTTLAIFMAAGTRLAPAALRIQQSFVSLNNGWGIAESTLDLIREVESSTKNQHDVSRFSDFHPGFSARIELKKVSFTYPLGRKRIIKDLDLQIDPGESIAIVGSSGSGKTTLIDLMMGLLSPDQGEIRLSGLNPCDAITKWPGSIGYVPQDIHISNTTVGRNVALGFQYDEVSEEAIWDALKRAQMEDFVKNLPYGLDTNLGERGMKISGGQKQRIGIARALLTQPQILFLDEATSALDGQTEHEVSEAIHCLRGQVTLICVAHRLSTAKRADRVLYLSNGEVIAQGNFNEVRNSVPDFRKQAELLDPSS